MGGRLGYSQGNGQGWGRERQGGRSCWRQLAGLLMFKGLLLVLLLGDNFRLFKSLSRHRPSSLKRLSLRLLVYMAQKMSGGNESFPHC